MIANLIAIVGCSFINFAASNAMVFRASHEQAGSRRCAIVVCRRRRDAVG